MERRVHLPNIVRVKLDIYWRTNEKDKMRHLMADSDSDEKIQIEGVVREEKNEEQSISI